MSRQTKILLFVTCGVFLAIILVCFTLFLKLISAGNVVTSVDPTEIAKFSNQICDFDMPIGFEPKTVVSIMGTTSIMLEDTGRQSTIWLSQTSVNDGVTPDDYLRSSVTNAKYPSVQWEVVNTQSVMIRGQSVILTAYSGISPDGHRYIAWGAAFSGKKGPAKLVIVSPEASWNEVAMKAFVASLR